MTNNGISIISTSTTVPPPCRLYKKRWIVLLLYCVCTTFSTIQLVQYLVITNTFTIFDNIADLNLQIVKFLIIYALFSFPGMYCLEKIGLRYSIIIAMVANLIVAWLKLIIEPNISWVFRLSHIIVCAFQVLVLPAPPILASTWFGPNEVSTACSVSTLGFQMGQLIAILLPLTQSLSEVENVVDVLAVVVAGASLTQTIFLFIFFQDKPLAPPSPGQIKVPLYKVSFNLGEALKKLLKRRSYWLVVVAYVLSQGVLLAILCLLDQIIQEYCPDSSSIETNSMRAVMITTGIVGSVLSGIALDQYRNYKTVGIIALGMAFLVMVSFWHIIPETIASIYARAALLGFSLRAMTTIACEAVAEITFPEPIAISSSILTCLALVGATLITFVYSNLFSEVGDICANLSLSALLLISIICLTYTRFNLNRHNSHKDFKTVSEC